MSVLRHYHLGFQGYHRQIAVLTPLMNANEHGDRSAHMADYNSANSNMFLCPKISAMDYRPRAKMHQIWNSRRLSRQALAASWLDSLGLHSQISPCNLSVCVSPSHYRGSPSLFSSEKQGQKPTDLKLWKGFEKPNGPMVLSGQTGTLHGNIWKASPMLSLHSWNCPSIPTNLFSLV